MVVALRWTFGTDRQVPTARLARSRRPRRRSGCWRRSPGCRAPLAAEVLQGRLAAAGIRATLSRDGPAYRILVFPDDLKAARVVLSRGALE